MSGDAANMITKVELFNNKGSNAKLFFAKNLPFNEAVDVIKRVIEEDVMTRLEESESKNCPF